MELALAVLAVGVIVLALVWLMHREAVRRDEMLLRAIERVAFPLMFQGALPVDGVVGAEAMREALRPVVDWDEDEHPDPINLDKPLDGDDRMFAQDTGDNELGFDPVGVDVLQQAMSERAVVVPPGYDPVAEMRAAAEHERGEA